MSLPSSIDTSKLTILDFLNWYRASYVANYDGDTVTLDLDFGFHHGNRKHVVRLLGINSPEVNKAESRQAGLRARDYLKNLIENRLIIVDSVKDRADKYGGRWLGVLWTQSEDGSWLNVNEEMIRAGHAVPFNP